MTQERKQLGFIHHAITTYLCQNHIQGEELVALEGVRENLLNHMREIDAQPLADVPDAPGTNTDVTEEVVEEATDVPATKRGKGGKKA